MESEDYIFERKPHKKEAQLNRLKTILERIQFLP